MRLVIHHLRKDLRYLRLLLLPWFVLLLINSFLLRCGLDLSVVSEEGIEVLSAAYVLTYVLQQLLQIVIVAQLVQADPLAGTTGFWLTRPVSKVEVLLSKSIFVMFVLLLPSLTIEAIVLRLNGISAFQTLSALLQETILQSALLLIPTMLLASLTSNLARLAITGIVSVTAFFLIHYAVMAFVMSVGAKRGANAGFPGHWPAIFPNNTSGVLASAILTIVAGGIVIAYQYLKRRTGKSGKYAALAACMVIVTLNFWSWDILKHTEWLPDRSGLNPESIKIVLDPESRAGFVNDDHGKLMVVRRIEIQGVPPDFFLEVVAHRAVVEFPNRNSVSSTLDYPWGFFNDWGSGGGLQFESHVKVLNDPSPIYRPMMVPLLSVDSSTFQQYRAIAGNYNAEAQLKVYQRVKSTLPTKVGSRRRTQLGELTLLRIIPNQHTLFAALSDSRRDGFVVTLRESGIRRWLQRTSLSGASYVLRNRARKEALFGRCHPSDIFGGFPTLHRLVVSHSSVYFTTAGIPDYQGPVIDDEWLEQAELVRVDSCFIGRFPKSVRAENFVMNVP